MDNNLNFANISEKDIENITALENKINSDGNTNIVLIAYESK